MTETVSSPARRSRLWLWITVAVVACAAGALAGHFVFSPKPASDQAVETFFQTRLPDARRARPGPGQSARQDRGDQLLAPWCGPCVEEMPELTALHEEYKSRQVEFVGIGIDSAANIQQFTRKVPVAYPLVVAGFAGTELSRNFGNSAGGLPYTVVINPDGSVKYRKMGRVTAEELRAVLPRA